LAGVILAWNLVKCLRFEVTIERGDRLISKEDDNGDAVADIMKSEAVELKFNAKEINVAGWQWDFDKNKWS
jgi:hypothetical protein